MRSLFLLRRFGGVRWLAWCRTRAAQRTDGGAERGVPRGSRTRSNYMNARANHIEVNLELAAILEEVLLHARAIEDPDWREGALCLNEGFLQREAPAAHRFR